jgi:phosphate transport system protein
MRDAYVQSLDALTEDVKRLIFSLKNTLHRTGEAMLKMDVRMATEIRDGDEFFDQMIREIMRKDLKIQVLQSPVAGDWRGLVGTFKILGDMERIADHCSDISSYVLRIAAAENPVPVPDGFDQMYADMEGLVNTAFDCYIKGDDRTAEFIRDKDDVVDANFNKILNELSSKIENDTDRMNTAAYVDYVLILKYIERMADHGTNIGEWVVYQKRNELQGKPLEM